MGDEANEKINALGVQISVSSTGTRDDYISLTDIARYKSDEPKMVIQNPISKASNSMPLEKKRA